jgi:FkbM family methyltransferase
VLPEIVDVEVGGIRMRCHTTDNYTERYIAIAGEKDVENLEHILFDLRPGDAFVDVGANIGLYSLNAARRVGPTGIVLAIDADNEMLVRLAFNADLNGMRNIECVHSAVTSEAGEIDFYVHPENRGQSSVDQQPNTTAIRVQALPLIEIVSRAGIREIRALKIDVEGHEDRALLPFFSSSQRTLWPKRLLLEKKHAHLWDTACIPFLQTIGYRLIWGNKNDQLLELSPS